MVVAENENIDVGISDNLVTLLRLLIQTIGNVTLEEAVSWAEVEQNAKQLLQEGHGPVPE